MGLFAPKSHGVRLRGSSRTKRLRKKRLAHLRQLYSQHRDRVFLRRLGMTYSQWRASREEG